MKKILDFIKKNQNRIFLLALLLEASVVFFWSDTYILQLGDHTSVYSTLNELYYRKFTWIDNYLGVIQTRGIAYLIVYQFPIYLLNKFGLSLIFLQKLLFFLWLFLPAYAINKLLLYILNNKYSSISAFVAANFYIFNMFSLQFFWYRPMVFFIYWSLPLILLYSIRLFEDNYSKSLLIIPILFFLSSPAGSNPIYLFLPIFVIFFYLFIDIMLRFDSVRVIKVKLKRFFLLMLLLFFVSALVILPQMSSVLSEKDTILSLSETNLEHIIKINSFSNFTQGWRLLGHWGFWGNYRGYSYFPYNDIYKSSFFVFIGFFIVVIALFSFFNKSMVKYTIFFGILFLSSIVLINGNNQSLGFIYKFLYENVPYFFIFRNPLDKVGIFYVFSLSCLLAISVNYILQKIEMIRHRVYNIFFRIIFPIILIFLINVYSFPFFTGQVFPDFEKSILTANRTTIPSYYEEAADYLNSKKLLSRKYGLPMQFVYRTPYIWKYIGVDPFYNYLKDGYFTTYFVYELKSVQKMLWNFRDKDLLSYVLLKLSRPFNIKYLILENDVDYKFYEHITPPDLVKSILSKRVDLVCSSFGKLDIYKIPNQWFSPFLYTTNEIYVLNGNIQTSLNFFFQAEFGLNPAIFLEEQNDKKLTVFNKLAEEKKYNLPILEFKKINPTKYRMHVHSAFGDFPLIFSANYDKSWRAYFVREDKELINEERSNKYRIFAGEEDDQATKQELEDFIKKGLISTLGDGKEKEIKHKKWENGKEKLDYVEKYNIDFISENFQGTIQNDNLSKGKFYETWLAGKLGEKKKGIVQGILRFAQNDNVKQLPDENHLTANGYANSWLIETDKICSQTDFCIKNPDGTYDFELVIEFWPQRLFYIGLFISGATLLGCVMYLVFGYVKKRRQKPKELEVNDRKV